MIGKCGFGRCVILYDSEGGEVGLYALGLLYGDLDGICCAAICLCWVLGISCQMLMLRTPRRASLLDDGGGKVNRCK
jgi:hypothetical protein